jgi:hypothetical protein
MDYLAKLLEARRVMVEGQATNGLPARGHP